MHLKRLSAACAHFCYKMLLHCGIWHTCILGFVRWVYWAVTEADLIVLCHFAESAHVMTSNFWLPCPPCVITELDYFTFSWHSPDGRPFGYVRDWQWRLNMVRISIRDQSALQIIDNPLQLWLTPVYI